MFKMKQWLVYNYFRTHRYKHDHVGGSCSKCGGSGTGHCCCLLRPQKKTEVSCHVN